MVVRRLFREHFLLLPTVRGMDSDKPLPVLAFRGSRKKTEGPAACLQEVSDGDFIEKRMVDIWCLLSVDSKLLRVCCAEFSLRFYCWKLSTYLTRLKDQPVAQFLSIFGDQEIKKGTLQSK